MRSLQYFNEFQSRYSHAGITHFLAWFVRREPWKWCAATVSLDLNPVSTSLGSLV